MRQFCFIWTFQRLNSILYSHGFPAQWISLIDWNFSQVNIHIYYYEITWSWKHYYVIKSSVRVKCWDYGQNNQSYKSSKWVIIFIIHINIHTHTHYNNIIGFGLKKTPIKKALWPIQDLFYFLWWSFWFVFHPFIAAKIALKSEPKILVRNYNRYEKLVICVDFVGFIMISLI